MNKIPKKLHLYWDKSPMSKLQVFTIETFHRLNPDWKIFVYVPIQPFTGNLNITPIYYGKNFFSMVENNSDVNIVDVDLNEYGVKTDLHNILRSDILRYHLLYNIGGVWSDFDVLWLQPMEYLSVITNSFDFLTTVCIFKRKHHNISILVSAQQHPLYKFIIDTCNLLQVSLKGVPNNQDYGTIMWNRIFPDLTGNDLLSQYPGVVSLEYATFFPYSIFEMERLYKKTDLSVITDNVMCVHWFNGHPYSKQYVNEDLFSKNYPCSMTKLLEQMGFVGDISD